MKRGLWAGDYITVHGPHNPADYMWGEADPTRATACEWLAALNAEEKGDKPPALISRLFGGKN